MKVKKTLRKYRNASKNESRNGIGLQIKANRNIAIIKKEITKMIAVMAASRKFSIQILVEQFPLCDQTFVKKILFATESYKQLRPISVIRLDVHNRVIFLLEKRPAKEFISSDNGQTVLLKKIRLIINFEMKLSRMPVVTANWLIGSGRR